MIDIRFNLFVAQKRGAIDENTKKTIAKVAKSIYFPYRNYPQIIDQTRKQYPALADRLEAFRSYISDNRQSLKERDAIKLIKYIKVRCSS